MSRKGAIVDEVGPRHKPKPCELTEHEVFLLIRAYTADKTMVTEEDAMTLCHWAQAQKFGAYVLDLVLEGHLRVVVEGQEVQVGLPG